MIKRYNQSKRLSEAVVYNGIAYLCGQCCYEENEGKKNIKIQTKEALENIERVLDKVGSDKRKILSATIYLKNINHFDEMNEIWENWLEEGYSPARACVEANLAEKELLVEIVVTAAL